MHHIHAGNKMNRRKTGSRAGLRSSELRVSTGIPVVLILSVFLMGIPPSVDAQEMVRVKVKSANVRSGPGTKFKKVWEVPRNYPYHVIAREGRWIKVRDFEGFEDWIYGPLTDRSPAVVIKVKRANARSGPGTKNPVVFTADKGVPFQVLEKKGQWVKVRANDQDEGWIFENLLWGFFKDPKVPISKKGKRRAPQKSRSAN